MKPVISVVGPTGVGKSEICYQVGKRFPLEIISADSRQIYRDMDIGTAKISEKRRREVPHHLIDIKNVDEQYSAYDFILDAREKIKDIRNREKIPLICGGTIFYINSMIEGMFEEPEISDEIRERVRKEIEERGPNEMHRELRKIDPESAERLHPNDKQRIARAMEVYRASGTPFSEFLKKSNKNRIPLEIYCLLPKRRDIYERINERVEEMFEKGFVDEVKKLLRKGYSPELYAFTSIGYRELAEFIESENDSDIEKVKEEIKKETRKYARKQITFIRNLPDKKVFQKRNKIKERLIERISEKSGDKTG